MGALVCSETSVSKYQHTLCNSPEEREPSPLRGGFLKSYTVRQFVCSDSKLQLLYLQAYDKKGYILVVSHVTLNNSCSSYSVNSYRQYDPHTPSNINLRQPDYLCFIRSRNWATLTDSIIAFLMSSVICVWQKKIAMSVMCGLWLTVRVWTRVYGRFLYEYATALLHIPYCYMEKWKFSSTHS
jgi:hypothetical protein